MFERGKLTPKFDEQTRKLHNLGVLQRMDPSVHRILLTARHVTLYHFNDDPLSPWSFKNIEGPLFLVNRNTPPRFQFIVLNRRSPENLVENILEDFLYEIQDSYLMYTNPGQEVTCMWFYEAHECKEVANLLDRILNAYSKVPMNLKVSPTKSDFGELKAVSTMAVIDDHHEPSPSTTFNAAGISDDPSFVNLFSFLYRICFAAPLLLASLTIGNTTNAPITAQPYQSSATISPTSLPVNEAPVIAHSLQLPSHSHHDTRDSGGGNQATNLVKPSFVTPTPSPSTMMTPPDFKDAPEFPPLPTTPSKQRPYGPWMQSHFHHQLHPILLFLLLLLLPMQITVQL